MSVAELARKLERTKDAIDWQARKLGLKVDLKKYQAMLRNQRRPMLDESILSCLRAGMPKHKICKLLGVSTGPIVRVMKENGIRLTKLRPLSDVEKRFIIDNWGKISTRTMAKMMHREAKRILLIAREAGLEILKPGKQIPGKRRKSYGRRRKNVTPMVRDGRGRYQATVSTE